MAAARSRLAAIGCQSMAQRRLSGLLAAAAVAFWPLVASAPSGMAGYAYVEEIPTGYCESPGEPHDGDLCAQPGVAASIASCQNLDTDNYLNGCDESCAQSRCDGDGNCKGFTYSSVAQKYKLKFNISFAHTHSFFRCFKKTDPSASVEGAVNIPPPETVTMKSWIFLKQSMANIGDEVEQIMLVSKEIQSVQEDLVNQEELWKQAELELTQENQRLKQEVEHIKEQLKQGEGPAATDEVHAAIQVQETINVNAKENFSHDQREWGLEKNYLADRRQELQGKVREINNTMQLEIRKETSAQLQVQTDAVALKLKVAELQDRLQRDRMGLDLQRQKAAEEAASMRKEIVDMTAGRERIKGQLVPRAPLEAELAALKAELQKEVEAFVAVREETAQTVSVCEQERKKRTEAKCGQEQKIALRQQEMLTMCTPAKGQQQTLVQMLRECVSQVGPGLPYTLLQKGSERRLRGDN